MPWRRLFTWIDLNAPFHGTWTEAGAKPEILARRLELRKIYAFDDYNPGGRSSIRTRKSDEVVMPEPLEPQADTRSQKPVVKSYKPGRAWSWTWATRSR